MHVSVPAKTPNALTKLPHKQCHACNAVDMPAGHITAFHHFGLLKGEIKTHLGTKDVPTAQLACLVRGNVYAPPL